MIHVIDDFLPIEYQEEIKHNLMGNRFPWYFQHDITFANNVIDDFDLETHPAHAHLFCRDQKITSTYFDMISPIAYRAMEYCRLNYTEIVQCRSFLQYPLNNNFVKRKVDKLHIDLPYDHVVVLYYVVDSDGDTVLVDRQRQNNIEEYHHKLEDNKIIKKVQPKQGRAIVFDGKYYHTAFQPEFSMRCVINFNLI